MPEPQPADQPYLLECLLAEIGRAALILTKADIAAALPSADRLTIIEEMAELLAHIRVMEGRIEDPQIWQAIHARADKLDASLRIFSCLERNRQ